MSTLGTQSLVANEMAARYAASGRLDRLQLEATLDGVARVVPRVWSLSEYVALNPWNGLTWGNLLEARAVMRSVCEAETLMPLDYYRQRLASGQLTIEAIRAALAEVDSMGWGVETLGSELTESTILSMLQSPSDATSRVSNSKTADQENRERNWRTISQWVDLQKSTNWSQSIVDEIGKHLAVYYDRGQAVWQRGDHHQSLYQAWQTAASSDRRLQWLGMRGLCDVIRQLPEQPLEALQWLLDRLGVPERGYRNFLLCQAFSIPGWAAWTNHQRDRAPADQAGGDDLTSLLAIRVAYDYALGQSLRFRVDWDSYTETSLEMSADVARIDSPPRDARGLPIPELSTVVRFVLLRASEIAAHRHLVSQFQTSGSVEEASSNEQPTRPRAQMVFCIDVRSERIRRHLESLDSSISTHSCAGFFGAPVGYQRLGESTGVSMVPALLQPQFVLHEGVLTADLPNGSDDSDHGIHAAEVAKNHEHLLRRARSAGWARLWKHFRASLAGSFAAVETTGLGFLANVFAGGRRSGKQSLVVRSQTGPTLRGLNDQGLTTSGQVDLAEGILRQMGLGDQLAPLVVVCGHESSTTNNPTDSSLQCGACGGHSGEVNARFVARLLNQPYVRNGLKKRGFELGSDVWFVAAVHNTTTDAIAFFDERDLPAHHQQQVEQLSADCQAVTRATLEERAETLRGSDGRIPGADHVAARSADWSQVRPEWGLVGNTSFVIGPRELTRNGNLKGRTFLHSYDPDSDPDGRLLEQIFAGPLMVTSMINLQYYASTVDAAMLGSGNKNIHNVVGQFGLLAGNGGDLQVGLPWQSVHDGSDWRHEPVRLHAYVQAPRSRVLEILEAQPGLAEMIANQWLFLHVLDGDDLYQLVAKSDGAQSRRVGQSVREWTFDYSQVGSCGFAG